MFHPPARSKYIPQEVPSEHAIKERIYSPSTRLNARREVLVPSLRISGVYGMVEAGVVNRSKKVLGNLTEAAVLCGHAEMRWWWYRSKKPIGSCRSDSKTRLGAGFYVIPRIVFYDNTGHARVFLYQKRFPPHRAKHRAISSWLAGKQIQEDLGTGSHTKNKIGNQTLILTRTHGRTATCVTFSYSLSRPVVLPMRTSKVQIQVLCLTIGANTSWFSGKDIRLYCYNVEFRLYPDRLLSINDSEIYALAGSSTVDILASVLGCGTRYTLPAYFLASTYGVTVLLSLTLDFKRIAAA
ncbi:hypothetical protein ARMSODRAFT_1071243 [Armillaria solidipes]|uniref:Uncharacterized protein n=1 Tax=Armillaria solidipes TaxID=1076256 RepID=A0A2H3B746_9AGAR|nr:hypothetical protein ARMSODRAFT_1071243 [Armillaria solidipes]